MQNLMYKLEMLSKDYRNKDSFINFKTFRNYIGNINYNNWIKLKEFKIRIIDKNIEGMYFNQIKIR
jgi:hypothetical protein